VRALVHLLLLLLLVPLLFACSSRQLCCADEVSKRKWRHLPGSASELRDLAKGLFHEDASPRDIADSAAAACKALSMSPDRALEAETAYLAARACNWLTYREVLPTWLDGDCLVFGEAAVEADPGIARGHYQLAIAIGLQIRGANVKSALLSIGWLVSVLEEVITLDEGLDEGGALRTLGLLYLRAPPWPTSVGDEEAALELLERAVSHHGDHPLNHLFYAEALLVDERVGEAKAALARFRQLNVAERFYWRSALWTQDAQELEKKIREVEDDL
jgi:hypothetical protein